jgi:hypothetical protein
MGPPWTRQRVQERLRTLEKTLDGRDNAGGYEHWALDYE